MKITICGSIAFFPEMLQAKASLEKNGHEVRLPPHEVPDGSGKMIFVKEYYDIRKNPKATAQWIWDQKKASMIDHFDKVAWADSILVLNHDKNGIKGYVGANTLIEMGLALWLKKRIYLLNEVPEISYKEEILGMKPILLNGNLEKIQITSC